MQRVLALAGTAATAAALVAIVRMLGYGVIHARHATVRVLEGSERIVAELAVLHVPSAGPTRGAGTILENPEVSRRL